MKNFDINRFGLALKCQFLSSRRQWLRLFGIYTLVMFMADLFFTRISYHSYSALSETYGEEAVLNTYRNIVHQTSGFGLFIMGVAMLFGACYVFSNLKETRQRTTYLMWPVSNLEKFLICLLHSIVLTGIGTMAAYMLADVLRMLYDMMTGRVIISGIPHFFSLLVPRNMEWEFNLWLVGCMLYFHSLYILGGSLFRRRQFLLTSIAIVIGFFIVMGAIRHGFNFLAYTPDDTMIRNQDNLKPGFYALIAIVYILTALHYWLSYKIFCRMQVINNKWLNL